MKEIIKVIECELLPSHYQLSCYLIFPKADDAIDKDFFINLRSIDYTGHRQAIVVFLQFLTKGPKSICLHSHHMASETQIIVLLKELSGHS